MISRRPGYVHHLTTTKDANGQYSPPSQVYPMQSTGQYDYETYDAYGQAGVGAGAVGEADNPMLPMTPLWDSASSPCPCGG